jgi:hypothetical protein
MITTEDEELIVILLLIKKICYAVAMLQQLMFYAVTCQLQFADVKLLFIRDGFFLIEDPQGQSQQQRYRSKFKARALIKGTHRFPVAFRLFVPATRCTR